MGLKKTNDLFKIVQSLSIKSKNSSLVLLIPDQQVFPEVYKCIYGHTSPLLKWGPQWAIHAVTHTQCESLPIKNLGCPLSLIEGDGSDAVGLLRQGSRKTCRYSFSLSLMEPSLCRELDHAEITMLSGSTASQELHAERQSHSWLGPQYSSRPSPMISNTSEEAFRKFSPCHSVAATTWERLWATTAQLCQEPREIIVNCHLKSSSFGWADRQQKLTGSVMYKTFFIFLPKCH